METRRTEIAKLRKQLIAFEMRESKLLEIERLSSSQRGELNNVRNKIFTIKFKMGNLKNHLPVLGQPTVTQPLTNNNNASRN